MSLRLAGTDPEGGPVTGNGGGPMSLANDTGGQSRQVLVMVKYAP
jgi:hypothetical protein